MEQLVRDFANTIESAVEALAELSEAESESRPTPGQWSAKEVLGHLIDSAANNHRWFVEAQGKGDLEFPGYDQEHWVAVQRYQQRPWRDLIALWAAYNRHLVHVVASIPDAELCRPRARHSLHKIAWRRVASERPASLEYLIGDYYAHLQAHLDSIVSHERCR